jgi:hypothetical protein
MTYAIICDARQGWRKGIRHLALVDRGKTRRYWWTSDDASLILNYHKKEAAANAVRRLRKNNARVVTFSDAVKIIDEQAREIVVAGAADDPSWDAHKCA